MLLSIISYSWVQIWWLEVTEDDSYDFHQWAFVPCLEVSTCVMLLCSFIQAIPLIFPLLYIKHTVKFLPHMCPGLIQSVLADLSWCSTNNQIADVTRFYCWPPNQYQDNRQQHLYARWVTVVRWEMSRLVLISDKDMSGLYVFHCILFACLFSVLPSCETNLPWHNLSKV